MDLRREPFRLFFPLGVLLGLVGVLPWLLFAGGGPVGYPATFHALTMTQGFLVALALGFLGTMIPRRTRTAPASGAELLGASMLLLAVPVLLALARPGLAELAFFGVLLGLARFVLTRLAASRTPLAAPPSFALVPVGLGLGATGAALVAWSTREGAPTWTGVVGRPLAQEGLLLGLVLALAPMLTSIIARGEGLEPVPPEPARRQRRLHLLAGGALAASFLLQASAPRLGLLLRGAVCGLELLLAGGLRSPVREPGVHRRLYRLALGLVPAGPLCAALWPAHRVALQHLTFAGAFTLLIYAVGAHVVLNHTGREELAAGNPRPLLAAAGLTLSAALLRGLVDQLGAFYLPGLGVAAALWLAGAVVWAGFVVPMLAAASSSR